MRYLSLHPGTAELVSDYLEATGHGGETAAEVNRAHAVNLDKMARTTYKVCGKGGKVRYLSLHPGTAELVSDYLEATGHGGETAAALFRPVKNNTGGTLEGRRPIQYPDGP